MSTYHRSGEWKAVKRSFIAGLRSRHGDVVDCGLCHGPLDLTANDGSVHIDHIESVEHAPELRSKHSNLRAVHAACHRLHTSAQRSRRPIARVELSEHQAGWYARVEHRPGCDCHLSPDLPRSKCW